MIADIKKVELKNIKSIVFFVIAFVPSLIVRLTKPSLWLICERIDHAEDNAWIFFQWLKQNHSEQNFCFILDESAPNFSSGDSGIVRWGSLRHYVYYLASSTWIMATFNTPMPDGRVCTFLNTIFCRQINKIYLRHGISKDGMEEHCYNLHHFRLFICGAKPEYDYVRIAGGYPEKNVKYTGFARFDDLYENSTKEPFILIIPTWRKYIGVDSTKSQKENEDAFMSSSFYNNYINLVHSREFISFLSEHNLKARFCLHAEYRRFEKFFSSDSNYIEIVGIEESIHDLIKTTSLLITDYSSVFFDAAYAGKPVIYYHFDYEEFRLKHLKEGYFNYILDGMGPVVNYEEDLLVEIKSSYDSGFKIRDAYCERVSRFFPLRDNKNCVRIYQEIMNISGDDRLKTT